MSDPARIGPSSNAAQLLSALPVVALILVAGRGLSLLIYLLLAIQAAFIALMTPARQAAVPTLVEKEELARANAFLFLTLFLAVLVVMGFDILSPLIVRDILQAGETLFSLIVGLVGLGSVLASPHPPNAHIDHERAPIAKSSQPSTPISLPS